MFDIVKKEIVWGDRKLILETGKLARQADGAVLLTCGETSILATVVAAKEANPESPLQEYALSPKLISTSPANVISPESTSL